MGDLLRCIAKLKLVRDEEGYGTFDIAMKSINRERLQLGDKDKPEKRKKLSPAKKRDLYTKQNGHCARCGAEMKFNEASEDHLQALAQGGSNKLSNIRLIHKACNSSKGANSLVKESKLGHGTILQQIEAMK